MPTLMPLTARSIKRHYRAGTMVLETIVEVASGSVRLLDFMSPQTGTSDVYRLIEGISGEVHVRSELIIRFDYGALLPWLQRTDRGIRAVAGPDAIHCFSDVRQEIVGSAVVTEFRVRAGQQTSFQLTWTEAHAPPPAERNVTQVLEDTQAWWTQWSQRCSYRGQWREDVVRSLITLKSLTYQPTGGIVAAATTSLPEHIGGTRNWDYRYCWLRDSTFTLYCLLVGGYVEEARAWRQWLVNAAAGDPAQLQIMYGVAGGCSWR